MLTLMQRQKLWPQSVWLVHLQKYEWQKVSVNWLLCLWEKFHFFEKDRHTWQSGWLSNWMTHCLTDWLADRPTDWTSDWLIGPFEKVTDFTDRPEKWVAYWLTDCNLGSVWLKPMLASSVSGLPCSMGSHIGFCRGYVFCLLAVCEYAVCFECHFTLSAFAPLCLSLSLATVTIWGGKHLHWLCQCDGARWLLPSGLPWIPACSVWGSYCSSTVPWHLFQAH